MSTLTVTAGCILVGAIAYSYFKALQSVDYIAGYRPMLSPTTPIGALIPSNWWNMGMHWGWEWRTSAFFNHSHDVISIVPWLVGVPSYYTCSLDVAKQLLGNEGTIPLIRPRRLTAVLLLWGENVFSSNGAQWKRHRRIMAPAFSTKTYAMVLQQTISSYREMCQVEGWDGHSDVVVNNFNRLPMRLAFLLIARCGFGLYVPWEDEEENAENMSVNEALKLVANTSIQRLIIPNWVYNLPIKRLRRIDNAWKSLAVFLNQFVEDRAQDLADHPNLVNERGDIFTRLVAARDASGKDGLNQDEVIGNTVVLMFAGHESTALTLNATFAYLGVYQDEQEKAYREIISTVPCNRDPTLDDLPKLNHVLGCFHEALRLLPTAAWFPRDIPEDVVIKVKYPEERSIVLKAGSAMVIDLLAIHRNPNIFPDPHKFKPSRWYGVSEHDVAMFGNGPRSCIGRKFSHVEALTFLAMFLRDWKMSVVLKDGETVEGFEKRVLESPGRVGLAFGIVEPINLKLTRRL